VLHLPPGGPAHYPRYDQTVDHFETMVGQGADGNLGACFKRAGYRSLGWTTGRGAVRPAGATHGARIWVDKPRKLVLYRGPLARCVPEQTHNRRRNG
jgi:hypothetical protein